MPTAITGISHSPVLQVPDERGLNTPPARVVTRSGPATARPRRLTDRQPPAPSILRSIREYARGVAGGLLFSLPLLYTMEMWELGLVTEPPRLLIGLGFGFVMLLGYNRYAGLHCDASLSEVVIDSVEELGLGLVLAAVLLSLLGSIDVGTRMPELMGKVVIEGIAIAIGVSVGTAQLGVESEDDDEDSDEDEDSDDDDRESAACVAQAPVQDVSEREPVRFLGQMTLAVCGAVLIATNVAPTEEIEVIARSLTIVHELGLTALTLAIGALVLYASEFRGSRLHVLHQKRTDVLFGTLATYLVSMCTAAGLLWFFGRFEDNGLAFCLTETIVLGLPTAIGASAGRLLLQQQ